MATRTYATLTYTDPAQVLDEPATKAEALRSARNSTKSGTPAFVQQWENGRPTRSWSV